MLAVKHRLVMTLAQAGIPVDTVTMGSPPTATYMRVLTQAEQELADSIIAGFDPSPEAQQAWEDAQNPVKSDLRNRVAGAIADLDAFAALANPTAAQVRAATQKIAQITRAMLLRLNEL